MQWRVATADISVCCIVQVSSTGGYARRPIKPHLPTHAVWRCQVIIVLHSAVIIALTVTTATVNISAHSASQRDSGSGGAR